MFISDNQIIRITGICVYPVIEYKGVKTDTQSSVTAQKTGGILSPPRRWRGGEQFFHQFMSPYKVSCIVYNTT
jgi:hypothetical protein